MCDNHVQNLKELNFLIGYIFVIHIRFVLNSKDGRMISELIGGIILATLLNYLKLFIKGKSSNSQ